SLWPSSRWRWCYWASGRSLCFRFSTASSRSYNRWRMDINGSTQIAGVFGSPIAHTASPALHNAAFAALKMNWAYLPFHVEPQDLRAALAGIRDMNFRGVNLTVPHKMLAFDLVDEVDADARRLGAINTVVVEGGKLRGFNTD